MRMRRAATALVIAGAAALLGACTNDEPDTAGGPTTSADGAEPSTAPRSTTAVVGVPPGVSVDAAILALRELDACGVLGPDATEGGEVRFTSPRSCHVVWPDGAEVLVGIGADRVEPLAVGAPEFERTAVGGALAWRRDLPDCELWLDAGLGLYVVVAASGAADDCATATDAAEAIVSRIEADADGTRLADPPPDACRLLDSAIGTRPNLVATRQDPAFGLDSCAASPDPDDPGADAPFTVQLAHWPVGGVAGQDEESRTIAGLPVRVAYVPEGCRFVWDVGPSGVVDPQHAVTVVRFTTYTCDDLEMTRLVEAYRTPPSPISAQRPVLLPATG